MSRARLAFASVGPLLLFVGCADVPADEPLEIIQRGAQQILTFEVSAPDPSEGLNSLSIRVTENGAPVDGVELEVDLWMDAHDHGANPILAEPRAPGSYDVDVVFSMPGTWTLSLRADGEVGDSCVIFVEVQ
jgi:hypothetical protein